MKIGYARVSTNDQNLDSQISLLIENGCEEIFEEKISGAKKTRPELEKLLSQMRASDTLVVCKLDGISAVFQRFFIQIMAVILLLTI